MLREAGDDAGAYRVLVQGLEDHPDTPDLIYDLAMVAEKLDKVDEAESRLKRLVELKPDDAQALNALGYTLVDRTPRTDEGLALIERAHKLSPKDPFILDSLGWAFYRMGRLDEAERYLQAGARRQAGCRNRGASRRSALAQGRSRPGARALEGATRFESRKSGAEGNGQAARALMRVRVAVVRAVAAVVATFAVLRGRMRLRAAARRRSRRRADAADAPFSIGGRISARRGDAGVAGAFTWTHDATHDAIDLVDAARADARASSKAARDGVDGPPAGRPHAKRRQRGANSPSVHSASRFPSMDCRRGCAAFPRAEPHSPSSAMRAGA